MSNDGQGGAASVSFDDRQQYRRTLVVGVVENPFRAFHTRGRDSPPPINIMLDQAVTNWAVLTKDRRFGHSGALEENPRTVMALDDLKVGGLVSWMSAPGAPLGVVVWLDASRVEVRFDLDDEMRVFARASRPLTRVTLQGAVRRASTGAIGVVQGQTNADPPRWQVILDGRVLTIPESDLRPHVLQDPVNRIRSGTGGTPRQFWLSLTARKYELDSRNSELVSLGESRVDLKPHQVSVVHRVITRYPHRFLLCDEVGLGKTTRRA